MNRASASFSNSPSLCESFHAVMTIMVIIITIRANHWSFQGENYPSVTCSSPGKAPKCPYYHHQGHSMCASLWMCVCVSIWLTLWPPTTLCSQPLRGALSQSVSAGTIEPEWALHRELQQPVSTVWQGFLCSRRTLCVSVGPSWPNC